MLEGIDPNIAQVALDTFANATQEVGISGYVGTALISGYLSTYATVFAHEVSHAYEIYRQRQKIDLIKIGIGPGIKIGKLLLNLIPLHGYVDSNLEVAKKQYEGILLAGGYGNILLAGATSILFNLPGVKESVLANPYLVIGAVASLLIQGLIGVGSFFPTSKVSDMYQVNELRRC